MKLYNKALNLHNLRPVKPLGQITFVVAILFTFSTINGQSEWKLEKSGKGINVYTRSIPETSIKEFKAEMLIKASMKDLEQALQQVEHHPEWMAGVEFTDILNIEPEILQYNLHLPFPFSDRYVVLSCKTQSDAGSYRLSLQHSDYPPGEVGDKVEIEFIKGYWLFTKVNEHTTSVVYQFVTDPGGSLPDWLVNSFIVRNPYKTLINLRERLE